MKQEYFYEYTGMANNDDGYMVKHEYPLVVRKRSLKDRIIGLYYGVDPKYKVVVLSPMPALYLSEEHFNENWKYKFMRVSG